MPQKPKFTKGKQLSSIYDLVICLQLGLWIYWGDRPKHPTVLWNMKLNTLRDAATQGKLFIAEEELP